MSKLHAANPASLCKWLHEQLQQLPICEFPFKSECLPQNGIYFFYEAGETWGHGGDAPRIVKIGTCTGDDNLRSRIEQHYLLGRCQTWMDFNLDKRAPKDRSVFRKHIGRALLNMGRDEYLCVWNQDCTKPANRKCYAHLRDIKKEKETELAITRLLRERFTFRFIIIDSNEKRTTLEKSLIGTITQCPLCKPSPNWLGNYHPDRRIQQYHSWLIQHAKHRPIDNAEQGIVLEAIRRTQEWVRLHWQESNERSA